MAENASDPRINIIENGPYVVKGGVPLFRLQIVVDENDECTGYREMCHYPDKKSYNLCRCGESNRRPYCDGTHTHTGFTSVCNGADSQRFADHIKSIKGSHVELLDAENFCIEARFCERAQGIWDLTRHSFENPENCRLAAEEAELCPAGRLVMLNEKGDEMEPNLEPSIAIIEDPSKHASSALWVRGKIPIYGCDGVQLELRNRVTLCRCGESSNKPFCDAGHYYSSAHFDDGCIEE